MGLIDFGQITALYLTTMSEWTMKVFTKRHGKEDPVKEAAGMLQIIRRLRGDPLIPKGVYRFETLDEADQWMIKKMASTHARLSSKI